METLNFCLYDFNMHFFHYPTVDGRWDTAWGDVGETRHTVALAKAKRDSCSGLSMQNQFTMIQFNANQQGVNFFSDSRNYCFKLLA